jgi:hypothetical protein
MDDVEKEEYRQKADLAKKKHAEDFPDYKFCPKPRKAKASKQKRAAAAELNCRKLGELLIDGVRGEELQKLAQNLDAVELTSRTEKTAKPRVRRRKPAPPVFDDLVLPPTSIVASPSSLPFVSLLPVLPSLDSC